MRKVVTGPTTEEWRAYWLSCRRMSPATGAPWTLIGRTNEHVTKDTPESDCNSH